MIVTIQWRQAESSNMNIIIKWLSLDGDIFQLSLTSCLCFLIGKKMLSLDVLTEVLVMMLWAGVWGLWGFTMFTFARIRELPSPLFLPCGQPSWNKTTKQSELTTQPCMQQVPRPSVWLVIVGGCNPDWSPSLSPSHLTGGRDWERLRSGTTSSHPGQLDSRLCQLNTSPLKHNS